MVTRKNLTDSLDRIASSIQNNPEGLRLTRREALRLAAVLDKVSNTLEDKVALDGDGLVAAPSGMNPEEIGEEVPGPFEAGIETVEGHFTQQDNRELRDKSDRGDVSPEVLDETPRSPEPGRQANVLASHLREVAAAYSPEIKKRAEAVAQILESLASTPIGSKVASRNAQRLQRVMVASTLIPWGTDEATLRQAFTLALRVADGF